MRGVMWSAEAEADRYADEVDELLALRGLVNRAQSGGRSGLALRGAPAGCCIGRPLRWAVASASAKEVTPQ